MCLIVLVVVVVVVVSMVVPIEVFPHVGSSNDDDDVEAPDVPSVGCCGAGAPRHPPPVGASRRRRNIAHRWHQPHQ